MTLDTLGANAPTAPGVLVKASPSAPEDSLTLLSVELTLRTPQEFYDYIVSLYVARAKRQKARPLPKLTGKIQTSATKKRNGTYVVTVDKKQIAILEFDKSKRVLSSTINVEHTNAVREFLVKKKFILDPPMGTQ